MQGLARVYGGQDPVQLLKEGHDHGGDPRLSVVVPDMDPMHFQGLGLHMALVATPPVSTILHLPGHAIIGIGVGLCGVEKLLLHLYVPPDGNQLSCLFMGPIGPLFLGGSRCKAQHGSIWDQVWQVVAGGGRGQ